MVTVLMFISSIVGPITYVAAESAATYVFSNVECRPGKTADVDITYSSTEVANLIAISGMTLSTADAEIVGFEFSDAAKAVINTGLSNFDPSTMSIVTLFNTPQTFDGVLGTLKVKFSETAEHGNVTISGTARVQNEGVGDVPSSVTDGTVFVRGDGAKFTFEVADDEVLAGETIDVAVKFATDMESNLVAIREIAFDSIDAEIVGFEFSDEANAVINTGLSNYDPNTKSIIVLFNNAQVFDGVIGTLKVKVAENASAGDIKISAGSRVQNEIGGWDVPTDVSDGKIVVGAIEVVDISVDKTSIEVPYAKSAKIAEYINDNINVKLVYSNSTTEDVAKSDVKLELGEGKATVSVEGYDFTKEVTYTIGEKKLISIRTEKNEKLIFEWNEKPGHNHAKDALGKTFARYEFDNEYGYIEEDITDQATYGFDDNNKPYAHFAGNRTWGAEYTVLSAPKKMAADRTELKVPYDTADWAAFVKANVAITVTREDGTPYAYQDEEVKVTLSDDKSQATFEFVAEGAEVEPVTVLLSLNTYTVTYKVNGEVVKEYTDVEEGSATPVYEYTAPEGYTFSGWGELPEKVTEDLIIEATTTANTYTVTYKVNGEVVKTEEVVYGAAIPAYNYEVAEGYTFSGWDAEIPATMPANDLEFNATTTIKTFTVIYKVDGVEVAKFENVAYGAEVPAHEYTAEEGKTFSGWGEVPATVTENLVIEGTTTIKTFTVTYKVDGEVVKTFENVEYGATVPAYNYEAAEGYIFSGWDDVPEKVTEDLVIEATTTIKTFTVIYKVDGEEVAKFENVAYGAEVPAYEYTAADGYKFSGWGVLPEKVTEDLVIEGTTEEIIEPERKVGDINGDGTVTSKDAIKLLNYIVLPEYFDISDYLAIYDSVDFNGDGKVTSKDAKHLLNSIAIPALYSLN